MTLAQSESEAMKIVVFDEADKPEQVVRLRLISNGNQVELWEVCEKGHFKPRCCIAHIDKDGVVLQAHYSGSLPKSKNSPHVASSLQ